MKKLLLYTSAVVLVLLCCLSACHSSETPQETEANTTIETATETNVETLAETTKETTAETTQETKHEYESGEFPEGCRIWFESDSHSTWVGKITGMISLQFHAEDEKYADMDDYSFEATVEAPSILQVMNIDKDALLTSHFYGGMTVKGLAEGSTRLTVTATYLPTGGICSVSTDFTVSPVYQYQAYPDDPAYVSLCDGDPRTVVDPLVHDGVELADYLVHVSSGETYEELISLMVIAHENGGDPADACTIEVTAKETDLVEIVSVDEQRLMSGYSGGVTLKTLATGTAHIYITFTNTASGQTSTLQMVLVIEDNAVNTPTE